MNVNETHTGIKNFNAAPLPFKGQKRRFVKEFKNIIAPVNDVKYIVDLFGGSGLLSHAAKTVKPECEVVYNDYDNYLSRIEKIPVTNKVLADIRSLIQEERIPKYSRIPEAVKQKIIGILKSYEQVGPLDYKTISPNILFPMAHVESANKLEKITIYNTITVNSYSAEGYLEGVNRVSMDYKDLIKEYAPQDSILIVDPPYLVMDKSNYEGGKFWGISQYLEILETLRTYRFVYFSADKSCIFEMMNWISKATDSCLNLFGCCRYSYSKCNATKSAKYTDIMVDNLNKDIKPC